MKVILSPAKKLDYKQTISTPFQSLPTFNKQANDLALKLQKMKQKELKTLMKLSENLAAINYSRYQNWIQPDRYQEMIKPAATVFDGAAYRGLDFGSLSKKEMENAQNTLYILSGLYGILKPLDLMYPYRLEMGTRWQISDKIKNLYTFWKEELTSFLNREMKAGEVLVNLASTEYFKAIDTKKLNATVITPVFKDLKGDQFKVVMMYAKTARGAMTRDIIQNQYSDIEDLKGYNVDGYSYHEEMSSENEWVFIR